MWYHHRQLKTPSYPWPRFPVAGRSDARGSPLPGTATRAPAAVSGEGAGSPDGAPVPGAWRPGRSGADRVHLARSTRSNIPRSFHFKTRGRSVQHNVVVKKQSNNIIIINNNNNSNNKIVNGDDLSSPSKTGNAPDVVLQPVK